VRQEGPLIESGPSYFFLAARVSEGFLPEGLFAAGLRGVAAFFAVFLEAILAGALAGTPGLADLARVEAIFAFNSALSAATLMVVADLRRRSRP
jgi:hypothetical protein